MKTAYCAETLPLNCCILEASKTAFPVLNLQNHFKAFMFHLKPYARECMHSWGLPRPGSHPQMPLLPWHGAWRHCNYFYLAPLFWRRWMTLPFCFLRSDHMGGVVHFCSSCPVCFSPLFKSSYTAVPAFWRLLLFRSQKGQNARVTFSVDSAILSGISGFAVWYSWGLITGNWIQLKKLFSTFSQLGCSLPTEEGFWLSSLCVPGIICLGSNSSSCTGINFSY